jgi:hypothetical protein
MITNGDLADTWLDLPQVEDDLPASKQDNDAQRLQDTDPENHETTRAHEEGMAMGTMIEGECFTRARFPVIRDLSKLLEEPSFAGNDSPSVDRAVYHGMSSESESRSLVVSWIVRSGGSAALCS